MRDSRDMALGPKIQKSGLERTRYFANEGTPFRFVLVTLEVEPVLDRGRPSVIGLRIGPVGAGRIELVTHPLGLVVRRKRRAAVPMGRANGDLGFIVIGLELLERDRPIK